jgi:Protein of unknown function (DUF2905)
MARFLIFLGLALVVSGLLWPYLAKLGIGQLPGDFVFRRGNSTIYIPIMTSIVLTIVLNVVLWTIGR